jgi:hypothetical protein
MKVLSFLLVPLFILPGVLNAQTSDVSPATGSTIKSSFIHVGSNKFEDALQNAAVIQAGLPIMKLFSQYAQIYLNSRVYPNKVSNIPSAKSSVQVFQSDKH